jgi:hypothetical protein
MFRLCSGVAVKILLRFKTFCKKITYCLLVFFLVRVYGQYFGKYFDIRTLSSAVGIATTVRGSNPSVGTRNFSFLFRLPLGHHWASHSMGTGVLYPKAKRPVPSGAEVNEWSYNSTPSIRFHGADRPDFYEIIRWKAICGLFHFISLCRYVYTKSAVNYKLIHTCPPPPPSPKHSLVTAGEVKHIMQYGALRVIIFWASVSVTFTTLSYALALCNVTEQISCWTHSRLFGNEGH